VAIVTAGATLAVGAATVLVQHFAPSSIEVMRLIRGNMTRLLLWAAFAGLVASPLDSLPRRIFSARVLRFFGKYSYGIYVIHAIVGLAIFRAHGVEAVAARVGSLPLAVGIVACATTLVSALGAMASYRFLESPFLALKARFAPGMPAPALATGSPLPVPARLVSDRATAELIGRPAMAGQSEHPPS
jgi:peptidoglycan/LPS O-acetylase OafA/YrhL